MQHTLHVSLSAFRLQLRRESVRKTLADLDVEKLDLLLMHWPDAWVPGSDKEPDAEVTIEETWCGCR